MKNTCKGASKGASLEEELWKLESGSENASGRKIVIPGEDISQNDQVSITDYDVYTNDAANVVKLNRHLIMDAEILEKALNEIKVICNGSVLILENRNIHEGLGTKLILRCNNSRYTSETCFYSTHKNQENHTRSIHLVPLVWET